jgi:hypothetical protein
MWADVREILPAVAMRLAAARALHVENDHDAGRHACDAAMTAGLE